MDDTRPPAASEVGGSLLTDVLAVVHELGATVPLGEVLELITDAAVGVLGFGASAINVATADGELRIEAVKGPPGVESLLGTTRPLSFWLEVLAAAEPWGELRFFSHERDQTLVDSFATWTPTGAPGPEPDAWHPDDSLLAPMWDGERLIGVLSVDQPLSGRRPDRAQCTVLEAFASQAGKAIRDAQARDHAAAQHREVEDRWRLAFEHSPTGVVLVGTDGRMLEANDALVSMFGYPREKLLTMTFADITHPDDLAKDVELFEQLLGGGLDSYQLEKRYLRSDGQVVQALLHVGSIRDDAGVVQTIVSQVSDISERTRAEERLAYQLTHDLLTGLPNRALTSDRLAALLAAGRATGVLFANVDRFKSINDSLGRAAGDELLLAVSQRLGEVLPSDAVLGRIDGDQFLVLAPGVDDRAALHRLGEQLIAALARPLSVGELRVTLGMSVGAAVATLLHLHANEVIGEAEQALARAKLHGRGQVEVYDPRQDHPFTLEDLQLEQALREAVETGDGLEIHLQPIVNVSDERVVGAESLIRWRHPVRGVLQPAGFLPIAELSGLIVPLGWRMLDLGVQAAARSEGSLGWVAVNVAASQLGRGQLPVRVRTALDQHGVAPQCLHLEITETALVDASADAIREVREVADMGVSIALDDFGTGYSSLSLLRDLPISVVKIDRSFIAPIAEDRRVAALVRSVVVMCNSLDISTVAEGVETREQLGLVAALGCNHAQGYLFDR